jgi:hypothetical protein
MGRKERRRKTEKKRKGGERGKEEKRRGLVTRLRAVLTAERVRRTRARVYYLLLALPPVLHLWEVHLYLPKIELNWRMRKGEGRRGKRGKEKKREEKRVSHEIASCLSSGENVPNASPRRLSPPRPSSHSPFMGGPLVST